MLVKQKAQGVMYSLIENKPIFLILKRSDDEGGYWQPLTGSVEDNESEFDCLKRELGEEVGLEAENVNFTDVIYTFDWSRNDIRYDEFVRGIEIPFNSQIKLSEEHQDFKWCSFDEALSLLKHESNKPGFIKIKELYSNES